MMRYRLTCLTPVLIGDGQRLAPIDYMVWRDQVNVLDQKRIFRLLAKGPRLESYLNQLRRAEKLDFASWGGFAQNFAGRRIPFEHTSSAALLERAAAVDCFIPTFASCPAGLYLPGSALKGPVRTALLMERLTEQHWTDLAAKMGGERPLRRPAELLESSLLGAPGVSRTKPVLFSDSKPVGSACTKVYLVRVATLVARGGKLELGWKQVNRGTVAPQRIEDSTPLFVEMAQPGTVFEGGYQERPAFRKPEMLRALRWREPAGRAKMIEALNAASERILAVQLQYAEQAGLPYLKRTVEALIQRLGDIRAARQGCLVNLGWGGGFLTKSAGPDTGLEPYRQILKQSYAYSRAIQTGLPFPKTRKVLFLSGHPASLPGWAHLDMG
jgi:CRISPR-associated protein Csm5